MQIYRNVFYIKLYFNFTLRLFFLYGVCEARKRKGMMAVWWQYLNQRCHEATLTLLKVFFQEKEGIHVILTAPSVCYGVS